MSLGIGVSDLFAAIKLSKKICDKCFAADQGADAKYQEFVRDIKVLGSSLEQFDTVYKAYERQNCRRDWRRDSFNANKLDNLWAQLIGDFHQTLRECDAALSNHGYLRNGRTNVAFNIRWWLSAQSTVDRLAARLKLHISRVDFYTQPVEFEMALKSGNEIAQLRRQVAKLERLLIHGPGQVQTLWADMISHELKERLESELRTDGPSWLVKGSEWPLKEAFESLAFHFAAGTVVFNPASDSGPVPEVSQYLNLAKSAWILEKIKQSPQFRMVDSESLWADRVRRVEDDLRAQVHRFEAGELQRPSMTELLGLAASYFRIDDGISKDSDPLDAGQAGPFEEKLLEIQLASDIPDRESALLVFRESETEFRLVMSTKQADSSGAQYDKEIEVSMDRDRLVPAYANPFQGHPPRHNILLCNGRKSKEFVFQSHEDVKRLQRSLTGYRVHHDMPVARWCLNGSRDKSDSGQGILQLWQFKPLESMSSKNPSEASDGRSSIRSPDSLLSSLKLQKSTSSTNLSSPVFGDKAEDASNFLRWSGFSHTGIADMIEIDKARTFGGFRGDDIFPSLPTPAAQSSSDSHGPRRKSSAVSGITQRSYGSLMSAVRGPRSDGIEFSRPELPVLVILTLYNGRYSILHLTLDASIKVDPALCSCRRPSRRCNRVIFTASRRPFTVRVLRADQEGNQGLDSWDLSVFRLPRPQKLQKAIANEKVKYLELQFGDEAEKNLFLSELVDLENNRTVNQNDYEKGLQDVRRRAHF